jgi:hypothetical protein
VKNRKTVSLWRLVAHFLLRYEVSFAGLLQGCHNNDVRTLFFLAYTSLTAKSAMKTALFVQTTNTQPSVACTTTRTKMIYTTHI